MGSYTIILFLLCVIIILTSLAEKLRLIVPIVLIILGMLIGFIPYIPTIDINSEIIFLLFLPPLLHDAAFNISHKEFKQNIQTITSLAIQLVFFTAIFIAVASYFLISWMTWPLAFLLGAILAATDAVAAISISKKVGISGKALTILEGESLINDASALVLYRLALSAVAGGIFIWWKALGTFAILLIGGAIIGFLMGKIITYVLRFILPSSLSVSALMLLSPFITYLIAEELHCSGVVAVVVNGLVLSKLSNREFPDKLKIQSKSLWDMIVFLLNGFIFILIGLEFPIVIKSTPVQLLIPYTFYAFLITIIIITVRILYIFMQRRNLFKGYKHPRIWNSSRPISRSILLSFKESLIIGCSGMRGIISLAMAIALPSSLAPGLDIIRNAILYISTVVVLITIIGQGLILIFIVKEKSEKLAD